MTISNDWREFHSAFDFSVNLAKSSRLGRSRQLGLNFFTDSESESIDLYSIKISPSPYIYDVTLHSSFWNQSCPHTHKCAILISALNPNCAGGGYTSRFISTILQQKSDYSMWGDLIGSKISDSRTVISMCP